MFDKLLISTLKQYNEFIGIYASLGNVLVRIRQELTTSDHEMMVAINGTKNGIMVCLYHKVIVKIEGNYDLNHVKAAIGYVMIKMVSHGLNAKVYSAKLIQAANIADVKNRCFVFRWLIYLFITHCLKLNHNILIGHCQLRERLEHAFCISRPEVLLPFDKCQLGYHVGFNSPSTIPGFVDLLVSLYNENQQILLGNCFNVSRT